MDPNEEVRLSELLGSLATVAQEEGDLRTRLTMVVRLATAVIPNCSGASIALLADGRPTTVYATDRVTLELDLVQYRLDEGPCLSALDGIIIRVGFTPLDEHYPHFAIGAQDLGVCSMLSVPIIAESHTIGTINLYSTVDRGFDQDSERLGAAFAAEASLALMDSRLLSAAIEHRQQVQENDDAFVETSIAQGVLMNSYGLSEHQAIAMLQQAADANHGSIVEAARVVVRSMTTPPTEPSGETPDPADD